MNMRHRSSSITGLSYPPPDWPIQPGYPMPMHGQTSQHPQGYPVRRTTGASSAWDLSMAQQQHPHQSFTLPYNQRHMSMQQV